MNKRRRYRAKRRRAEQLYVRRVRNGDFATSLNAVLTRFCRLFGSHDELRRIRRLCAPLPFDYWLHE